VLMANQISPLRLRQVLQPESVAIAGAAERATSAGGAVLKNLRASGYQGRVVPVNPKGGTILDRPAATSLELVSPPCDLVVVAVRPDLILEVIRQGIAGGHRNYLVLPGGFQEAGAEGLARDVELRGLVAEHDILVMGPNCAGLINVLNPDKGFAATFFNDLPFRGVDAQRPGMAFVSQSGAIAEEVIAASHSMQIPIRAVVSVGNGMQLELLDFICGLAEDPECSGILFYAESVGDAERFAQALRSISARKPIVGLIAGTSAAGANAARRHTGSTALSDREADELCARAGVLRVTTLREMLLAAKALSFYPNGMGRRVLVLSNSGGPGVLVADRSAREGLDLPPLPATLRTQLTKLLPPEATVSNPIDLLADAREDRFGAVLKAVLGEAETAFDAVLMIHVVPFMVDGGRVIEALASVVAEAKVPILHSMMGTLSNKQAWFSALERTGVPMFNDAEEMTLAAACLLRRHNQL
jgi:acyl-CoA synthetase (NDP forming)